MNDLLEDYVRRNYPGSTVIFDSYDFTRHNADGLNFAIFLTSQTEGRYIFYTLTHHGWFLDITNTMSHRDDTRDILLARGDKPIDKLFYVWNVWINNTSAGRNNWPMLRDFIHRFGLVTNIETNFSHDIMRIETTVVRGEYEYKVITDNWYIYYVFGERSPASQPRFMSEEEANDITQAAIQREEAFHQYNRGLPLFRFSQIDPSDGRDEREYWDMPSEYFGNIRNNQQEEEVRFYKEGPGLFKRGVKAFKPLPIEEQVKRIRKLKPVIKYNDNKHSAVIDLEWAGKYEVYLGERPFAYRLDKVKSTKKNGLKIKLENPAHRNPFISSSNNEICMGTVFDKYKRCIDSGNYLEALKLVNAVLKCKKDHKGYRRWNECKKNRFFKKNKQPNTLGLLQQAHRYMTGGRDADYRLFN